MPDLVEEIRKAENNEIEDILKAVLVRYQELYPGWELCTISFEKSVDKTAQLDGIITML